MPNADGTPVIDVFVPTFGSPIDGSGEVDVAQSDSGFAASLKAAGLVPYTPVTL